MSELTETESASQRRRREGLVLIILAAVQFITIVDFMIVMPLGPQLTESLGIDLAQFGRIVSSYTFAAGAAGLVASAFVDRFPRRTTFMTLNSGFLVGTLCCALAPNYLTLVLARIGTGAFGGILGGVSMTIIGDVFPEERRGRATGLLMSGFAVASVVGVPFGLYLGDKFGWQVPFYVLVVGGLPTLLLTPLALPRLDAHVGKSTAHPLRSVLDNFTIGNHLRSFALMIALVIGAFTVFPYISVYLVGNVGFPRQQLPLVYIAGGTLTLFASPIIGWFADRFGRLKVFRIMAPLSAIMLLTITHLPPAPVAVAVLVFGMLMVCNVGRMIAATALVMNSIEPHRRGGFLSANSSVQHITSGIAASLGGAIVTETAGRMEDFGIVGWIAAGSTLLSLYLAGRIRAVDQGSVVSAKAISLAAAAEATADTAEPMVGLAEETSTAP